MSFSRPLIHVAFVVMLALVIGCSGGGNTPVTPDDTHQPNTSDNVPIIGLAETGDGFNAVGMLGAYELNLDAENMTAEVVSKRTSTIGTSWTLEGLSYFTITPCSDCFDMTEIMWEAPYIKVSFVLSHPFQPGNPELPPSGKNRLDLDIFDVAVVIHPTATTSDNFNIGKVYGKICGETSGYTAELGDFIADPVGCPYYLVIDDSIPEVSSNNRLAMGTVDAPVDLYFAAGGKFDLFLTFGYGWSAVKKDRLNPMYYLPEFNRKNPWKVKVTPPEGDNPPSCLNTWNHLDIDVPWPVMVEVYDWQQGATVDPNLVNLTDVFAASNVSKVTLEIPGMLSAPQNKTVADSGSGRPDDPLVYTFNIPNARGLAIGKYLSLVKVEDERVPQNPIVDRDHLIQSPDGLTLDYYTIPTYTTYQTFIATVLKKCGPITGVLNSPNTCPKYGVYDGARVGCSATASSDNDGNPITKYEWDSDYDGVTFDVDAVGRSASLGPYENPNCGGSEEPVDYTIAVRAYDSCDPVNCTMFATCQIWVDHCDLPPIYSEKFVPKPADDEWFDVCVENGGAGMVLVVADHPETDNVGGSVSPPGTRTLLSFTNDLGTMDVINPGTGMANPWPGWQQFTEDWNRFDVSGQLAGYGLAGGQNLGGHAQCRWDIVDSTTAVNTNAWVFWCYGPPFANLLDIFDHYGTTWGTMISNYSEYPDPCAPGALFDIVGANQESDDYFGGLYYAMSTDALLDIVGKLNGAKGLPNTNMVLALISNSTDTGNLKVVGPDCYSWGALSEVSSFKSYGFGDDEISGGLDIAMDSQGNIVICEDQGGSFRFQKFNNYAANFTLNYSSPWIDDGDPMRMDFDTASGKMYLISTTGIHQMYVTP